MKSKYNVLDSTFSDISIKDKFLFDFLLSLKSSFIFETNSIKTLCEESFFPSITKDKIASSSLKVTFSFKKSGLKLKNLIEKLLVQFLYY